MTALIEPTPIRRRVPAPVVDVAGTDWPRHKVLAVVAGLLAALLTLSVTGSGQVTMWVTAVVVLAFWWGDRIRQVVGDAATAPRSNPPGIS
ncbi:hypothetical protein [Gordonia soli]|uniref:Uncharacterized protein n=1 Tax=Gordonia soli NBRC 108243 TaxID=1223545 RepID=M0QP13_9ACTN|nr:hypothetical protein [Gordonia soli]GAC70011.1 hypothetical protein GS4_30_00830 [Gordonia soli NBRC 108243]